MGNATRPPDPPRGRSTAPRRGVIRGRGRGGFQPRYSTRNSRTSPAMPPDRTRKASLASRLSDPSPESARGRRQPSQTGRGTYAAVVASSAADIMKVAADIVAKAPTIPLDEVIQLAETLPIGQTQRKKLTPTIQGIRNSTVVVMGLVIIPEQLISTMLTSIRSDERSADLRGHELSVTVNRMGITFRGGQTLYKQHRDAARDALVKATGQSDEGVTAHALSSKDRKAADIIETRPYHRRNCRCGPHAPSRNERKHPC